MTIRQEWAVGKKLLSYETYKIRVLKFVFESVSSVEQNRKGSWLKMVLVAVEASSVGRKPPAAVGERISEDGRHDLGDAAPFSTRTSSLQGRVGGSGIMPTLVELVFGPG